MYLLASDSRECELLLVCGVMSVPVCIKQGTDILHSFCIDPGVNYLIWGNVMLCF